MYGSPVTVQSMTTTLTSDVNATLQQIAELTATGCDIVRVACPSQDDADALAEIAQHSQIPVIADIHFQPKYVFAAIDAATAAGARVSYDPNLRLKLWPLYAFNLELAKAAWVSPERKAEIAKALAARACVGHSRKACQKAGRASAGA